MFRNIEAVYRVNRSFLKVCYASTSLRFWAFLKAIAPVFPQSLREIGPNPSSPKALGDLLMRWVSVA